MSIETADILRKLALGQATIIFILIVWTVVRYTKKILSAPDNERALPAHVALIAVSYLHFLVYACISIYERFDELPTWRIPLALSGCVFGTAALAFLMSHLSVSRYLRARIDREADKAAMAAALLKAAAIERRIDRMEEVGIETHDAVQGIRKDSLPEIRDAATHAYHEANQVNTKIADLAALRMQKIDEVILALDAIKVEALAAKTTAAIVSDKADNIGDVGADTNERVRHIQTGEQGEKKPTQI